MYTVKKHEWYGLSTPEKTNTVLKLINEQGYTADELNDYFDVRTKRVITDHMNRNGYSKQGNIYVPKDTNGSTIRAPRAATAVATRKENTAMANINEEVLLNMVSLSKQHNKIQEIIEWFDNRDAAEEATIESDTIIELIDTSLPIPKVTGETKRTTIRVNENIMANFNNVWKKRYGEYKQHDLLNLALQEFIDKYDK